jgi:catechol 2,3-dioxygenase-like lactoylglutathione lyase family enzyme
MGLIHHVSVGVADIARAAAFYDAILAPLGQRRAFAADGLFVAYGRMGEDLFFVTLPHDEGPADPGNGVHICFSAPSRPAVDALYEAALAHGGTDDGPPGLRSEYDRRYYACFVRDPDGNKIEALTFSAT